ncbi:MAG: NAD-dependent protein deacylase, partial [Chloroflexia bacterium]|nr:NAD-dependent protein deacylase [Chloroflexia bacterium]
MSLTIDPGNCIGHAGGYHQHIAPPALPQQQRVVDGSLFATPEGFARDPDLVLRFYDMRREAIQTKQPNPAHHALGRLEREWPKRVPGGGVTLVTQNVDDLHERGGSLSIIHMHGEHL